MKKILFLASLLMVVFGLAGCFEVVPKNFTLQISASATEAKAGDTVTLSYTLNPTAADKVVVWEIVKGEEYASIENQVLTIAEDAEPNAEIVVKAKLSDLTNVISNTVTIKVVKPVVSLSVSASSNLVEVGGAVDLSVEVTPADATNIDVQWVIVEGSNFAFINNNRLVVLANTTPGSLVKVKAVNGTIESDVLLFTVYDPKQDELRLVMPFDQVKADINDEQKSILAKVYDGHLNPVTDREIEFIVIEGEDFLDLNVNGYQCDLIPKGHGVAKLRTQIKGTAIFHDMTVNVVVPPIALRLPGVFEERPNYVYSVGKSFQMPFTVTTIKDEDVTKVSEDLVYTFTKKDSTAPSNEIATVQDGKITFLTTGEIKVTVRSNSGSKQEVSTQYTFNVNNGVTVTTYEEFKEAVEKPNRVVSEELNENLINIVVLEKVINDNRYGYDLVPQYIVNNYQDPMQQDIFDVQSTQIFGNGDYEIIGNNHLINLVDQRVLTPADYEIINQQLPNPAYNVDDLLQFRAVVGAMTLKVHIRDLKLKGNCGIDFKQYVGETPRAIGVHRYAMYLNKSNANNERVAIDMRLENVSITQFASGLLVRYAYNSLITKCTIDNIFATGLAFMASKVELNDMTFGPCGASAFEFQGDNFNMAPTSKGPDAQFIDNQKGVISGYFNTTNFNDGRTEYLSHYQQTLLQDNTIVDIIAMNLQRNQAAMNSVMNAKGEILFAGLAFIGVDDNGGFIPNGTEISFPVSYVDYDRMTANDTTNKFITLDLLVPLPQGQTNVGKVILINLNYQGN